MIVAVHLHTCLLQCLTSLASGYVGGIDTIEVHHVVCYCYYDYAREQWRRHLNLCRVVFRSSHSDVSHIAFPGAADPVQPSDADEHRLRGGE